MEDWDAEEKQTYIQNFNSIHFIALLVIYIVFMWGVYCLKYLDVCAQYLI